MNATQGLVKSYKCDAPITAQYSAVVVGTSGSSPGYANCTLPAGANAKGFLGIALETQSVAGRGVAVQKNAIARAIANGAIAAGDRCIIASAAGDVKSVEALIAAGLENPATEYYVVGRAEEPAVNGQIFALWLLPETVALAVS